MKSIINKMVILAVMLVVFVLPTICLSQESVAECDAMMLKLNKQISALKKQNPNVSYAEKENPSINVQKSMRKTFVNRVFMCPFHKGFAYAANGRCSGATDAYGRELPCKAQSKYLEWKRLVDSIPETERIDAEIESLQNQVKELKETRSNLSATPKSKPKNDSRSKIIINLKRSSVKKLLQDGIIENDKMKIVLVDD